jgi:hypothetical protein
VSPADAPDLCEAILQIAPDADLMARLGTNARTLFEARYTEERMLSAYKQMYFDLLREKCPIEASGIGVRNDNSPARSVASVGNP